MKEVELEAVELAVRQRISSQLAALCAEPATVGAAWDPTFDGVVITIRQRIAGKTLEVIEESWPADWWQAVKARWFPRWALARWPAQMRSVRLEAVAMYPKLPLPRDHRFSLRYGVALDLLKTNGSWLQSGGEA
jgi:hypothetical protein